MGTFTKAIIREIGRNYGMAISNFLLGDAHSRPVRITGSSREPSVPGALGLGSGGRNYDNKLDKLLDTYSIKGPTATFNVAQNMVNYYMDLVEEAQEDSNFNILEADYLVKKYVHVRKELQTLEEALNELDKPDWGEKVLNKIDDIDSFIISLHENFKVPDAPGWGFGKKHKLKKLSHKVALNVKTNLDSINNQLSL